MFSLKGNIKRLIVLPLRENIQGEKVAHNPARATNWATNE